MTKTEVTEENKRKLIKYSQELFEQSGNDRDYPFKTWQQQFDECYDLYRNGNMSQEFLDFATQGVEL